MPEVSEGLDEYTETQSIQDRDGDGKMLRKMACGAQMLLCLITLAVLPPDWLLPVAIAQQVPQGPGELDTELTTDPTGSLDDSGPTTTSECREEQFPCTRLYSVHKPVKQCISYLCITSVRRTYMINKEICSRVVCKEDEAMQEKICRQMAGLPPRRLRRTGHPPRPLCRRAQNQPLNTVDAQ
ncbi:microfibrillar-associated protein 5 isoform X3 [Hemicordylus capensis]|uniref:microfibrillar-associated protein 5 isoform X3 n=1 Tax=Hemicordylus capensis TaxID=884348 RepID=UPI002304939D|nr:microfibrillar-associated protein 5 isoform X3 [Hemicordylus capensis]XP_053157305.1 microfibrillar-associated protein 5 isoform X3 [Hemicordylus capensis]XP_053157306.1 microfibrillar-associated protein 5 isoform X3 [Hemicordylus capensis]XP_053157307.1 microfibrillar-associated protein 5 isoform X3 [Hemicordylus capensis]